MHRANLLLMPVRISTKHVGRHKISAALIDLRQHLGETQQDFANRMRVAVTTVARWETSRPPRGKILAELEQVARNSGANELAEFFLAALQKELGSGAFEPLRKVRRNPWRLHSRESLVSAFDEFIASANSQGKVVSAARLEFDTDDGNTAVLDVAPPSVQTVNHRGKRVKKKIQLPRGPRLQIFG